MKDFYPNQCKRAYKFINTRPSGWFVSDGRLFNLAVSSGPRNHVRAVRAVGMGPGGGCVARPGGNNETRLAAPLGAGEACGKQTNALPRVLLQCIVARVEINPLATGAECVWLFYSGWATFVE